jgi:hypothetical protein
VNSFVDWSVPISFPQDVRVGYDRFEAELSLKFLRSDDLDAGVNDWKKKWSLKSAALRFEFADSSQ